jgi:predicted component of type VI protein secretion system
MPNTNCQDASLKAVDIQEKPCVVDSLCSAVATLSSPLPAADAPECVAVDPYLRPLVDALIELKIGLPKPCIAFAMQLGLEGVMCVDDLRLMSESEVHEMLRRLGFLKVQQLKLLQAVFQLKSASPLSNSNNSAGDNASSLKEELGADSGSAVALESNNEQQQQLKSGNDWYNQLLVFIFAVVCGVICVNEFKLELPE